MPEFVVSKFPGIAPRVRSAQPGIVTFAKTAVNADLYGETVRSYKGNSLEDTSHTGSEFAYYLGDYISGHSNYINWIMDDFDMLIYQDGSVLKKQVGGVEATLGIGRAVGFDVIEVPIQTPVENFNITETDDSANYLEYKNYTYVVTLSRFDTLGNELESYISGYKQVSPYTAPGVVEDALSLQNTNPAYFATLNYDPVTGQYTSGTDLRKHAISRPVISDSTVTQWNLYRSDDGDTPRLIGSGSAFGVGEGLDFITDITVSSARGRYIYTVNPKPEEEQYKFSYVITWERSVNGQVDESGPSDPLDIVVDTIGANISIPTNPPALAISWNIYRLSQDYDATSEYQLVAKIPVTTNTHYDTATNNDLQSVTLATHYTTDEGDIVVYEKPLSDFDGVFGPVNAMLFAWKKGELYFSEPGNPDAWPVFNHLPAGDTIVSVGRNGSEAVVLTTTGLQRVIGTDPEKLYLSASVTSEGGVSQRASLSYSGGFVYLSDSGLNVYAGGVVTSLTDKTIGEEFFRGINYDSTFMAFNDGVIYMFHDAGALIYDTRVFEFSTLDAIYTHAIHRGETGHLYVMNAGGEIQKLHGSNDDLSVVYTSGEVVLQEPENKRFRRVKVSGTGIWQAALILDGVEFSTKTLNLDSNLNRDKKVDTPHGTRSRAAQIRLTGEGEVTEVKWEIFEAL